MKRVPVNVWETWLGRLYNLRRDKRGAYERPHKPVLLLSIIDLLDRGLLHENAVALNDELVSSFKRHFAVVRQHNDRPTIENPFHFLAGDRLWRVTPGDGGDPLYREGEATAAPSAARLRRIHAIGRFDGGLWELLRDPGARHQLREALVARYFPGQREALAALRFPAPASADTLHDELPPNPARDSAFRRTILEVYDHRCAACGLRVLLNHVESLAQAAHLIPFHRSFNDHPTNGMALCPNHHWAMDRNLIAPCPDTRHRAGVWRVNERRLDDRIEGQREFAALAGRRVIPPSDQQFFPAQESLLWCEHHLTAKY